ncbi:hypothetical protein DL93DRAFT_1654222 [Clavulina sp. PMI_390]|nr:hypothetical protein DL93DRAFT_1654222 [Clavulina sp. PMI_390]
MMARTRYFWCYDNRIRWYGSLDCCSITLVPGLAPKVQHGANRAFAHAIVVVDDACSRCSAPKSLSIRIPGAGSGFVDLPTARGGGGGAASSPGDCKRGVSSRRGVVDSEESATRSGTGGVSTRTAALAGAPVGRDSGGPAFPPVMEVVDASRSTSVEADEVEDVRVMEGPERASFVESSSSFRADGSSFSIRSPNHFRRNIADCLGYRACVW